MKIIYIIDLYLFIFYLKIIKGNRTEIFLKVLVLDLKIEYDSEHFRRIAQLVRALR